MDTLLLGIDVGTSGCNITVIDPQGAIVGEAFGEHRSFHPHPGWSEQEPDEWYDVVRGLLRELFARGTCTAEQIAAVSLDGSTHNAVLADANFRPLRPTIMWTDQRSVAESRRLAEEHGERIFATAYQMPSPTWTLPQLLWVKEHEPRVLDNVAHLLFTKDYVRYRLTGSWETDHIEAQGSLFYDMRERAWSTSLAELAGLSADVLPPLVNPTDVVGSVTKICGRGDRVEGGYAGRRGLFRFRRRRLCRRCRRTGTDDSQTGDRGKRQRDDGRSTPASADIDLLTRCSRNVVQRGRPRTRPHRPSAGSAIGSAPSTIDESEKRGVSAYALMHEQAAAVPPGSDGLFFHPYLLGERSPYWDVNLRSSFVGATMRHSKAHFLRALLEGVAFSLRDCFRMIVELDLPVSEIRLIGGGAKSPLWSQIISDIFGQPVIRPAGCDASFGAALLAGIGAGVFADEITAVKTCTKIRDTIEPNPQRVGIYAELFPLYREIHDNLASTYTKLSQVLEKSEDVQ